MKMIPVKGIIAHFQRMFREGWKYTWGHAQDGDVDCSGAFVNAYRKYGRSIYHGSNTIARKHVQKLLPVSEARPGMAAFKLRKPGHRYYDLPAKFRTGGADCNGDLNDYYHIGLVDDDGRHVLNAQSESAGFTRTKIGLWAAVGYLNAVDYGSTPKGGAKTMQEMIVACPPGETVNVRDKANGKRIDKLTPGTTVMAGDDVNGWREIVYGDTGGYMSSAFLKPATAAATTPTDLADDAEPQAYVKTLTTDDLNALSGAMDKVEAAAKTFRDILGAG